MKHKLMINNDRKIPMRIRVVDTSDVSWEGRWFTIEPANIRSFTLDLPEGQMPYLKVWEDNVAFLSGVEEMTIP